MDHICQCAKNEDEVFVAKGGCHRCYKCGQPMKYGELTLREICILVFDELQLVKRMLEEMK